MAKINESKLRIDWVDINSVIPYDNNPRKNEDAVDKVASSIMEFGWQQPIVVDEDNVVIVGHTRLKAAYQLGLDKVPVTVADNLTPEQVKAYRLADNKVADFAEWDFSALEQELDSISAIDMSQFGFNEAFSGSYIDSLMEEGFAPGAAESDEFSVTFVFNKRNEAEVQDFIKQYGKQPIVEQILKFILNGIEVGDEEAEPADGEEVQGDA